MDSGLPPEVWLRLCNADSTRVFTVSVGVIAGAAVAVAHSSRAAVRVIGTRRMRSPRFGMPRITLLDRTGSAGRGFHPHVLFVSPGRREAIAPMNRVLATRASTGAVVVVDLGGTWVRVVAEAPARRAFR